jgi:hypothetical protein
MKALVYGGRTFGMKVTLTSRHPVLQITSVADVKRLFARLDKLHEKIGITRLIAGCAPGADFLGAVWAASRGITVHEFPANWDNQGSSAGPIRNQLMDDEHPDYAVRCPGNAGTADMTRRLEKSGVTEIEDLL